MRSTCLLAIYCLLVLLAAAWAGAATFEAPLVKDATASAAFLKAALAAGKCTAADVLAKKQTGVVQSGSTPVQLAPGRYRLHAPLALSPLGDLRVSAIAITLTAADTKRTLGMLQFAKADEFTDMTVDFTVTAKRYAPYSISWALTGLTADRNRKNALVVPGDPDPDAKDTGDDVDAPEQGENGAINIKDLAKIKCHLAACGVHIEPLSPVMISEVTTDKIVYKPGEHGAATVTLKNTSEQTAAVALTVVINAGLSTRRETATAKIDLPAGETKQWTGEFTATDLHWGAELMATARVEGYAPASGRAVFGVTDNFWETAIASGIMFTRSYIDRKAADAKAEDLRAQGYTMIESGFWAPDEFGDFTPDKDLFFGGQNSYPGSVTGTKNINDACHQRGISTSVYANLWGGDGAPSFEMMRKHPDWISTAWGASDWVENWYLQETNKIPQFLIWMGNNINRQYSDDALKYHANELVASHRTLGWDGVRYDSYYSDNWVTPSTKRVRELVEKEEPHYRWGYNSIIPYDVNANALDIMVGGGNLAMEEGIRGIVQRGGSSFASYANTVVTYRDIVWPHGGHLGVCYDSPRGAPGKSDASELDQIYLSTILLASGVHPYYSPLESEYGQHARFALRYAEFIYNDAMRRLKSPESAITFGGTPNLLEWKRLARTVDLGGDRHRLVIHLLNAPVKDQCLHNPELKLPAPLRDLPITVALPAGAAVDGAWLLGPSPDAHHEALPVVAGGNAVTVTVPEVRIWGVVVIDFHAKDGIAARTTPTDEEEAMKPKPKPAETAPAKVVEVKKQLTDEEEAVKAKVTAPAEWIFPPQQPLRVLAVHGLWYREQAVERALARMGGVFVDNCWESVPDGMRYYPDSYEGLMGHHLVVIGNVNADAFGPIRRKMLKDYVAQGGAVLFLGGWYAFGPGYHNSVFEEISPVTYPEKPNDPPNQQSPGVWKSALPDGFTLAPGKDIIGSGFGKLNWIAAPRVFWYNPLTPKDGAKVLLTADGKPLLVAGTYGKGRVAVYGGTVLGDPPAGKLPYWQWDGWPSILADTMNWLVAGTAKPVTELSAEARGKLSKQLLGIGTKKLAAITPIITQYARICGDKDTAKLLLAGIATLDGDAPQALVDLVSDGTRAQVDATFTDTAQQLLDSGQTNKASLGLRVLGGIKTPAAKKTLENAAESGEVSAGAGDADEPGKQIEDPQYTHYLIRLGAMEGLGDLGDPAELPQLREAMNKYARTKSKVENLDVYLVTQDDELYQQAALAVLRCGDATAAAPAIDSLLNTLYIIARQIRMLDHVPYEDEVGYKVMQANIRRQFDRVYARQQQLYWQLTSLPPSVLPALAKRIAAEDDPLIIPIASIAFGRGFSKTPFPAEVLATLKSSKLPAVAELGNGR